MKTNRRKFISTAIEYLQDRNNFLCRVRSKDGAEGISAGHGSQNKTNWHLKKLHQ
jgi:hypothetical protein